MKLISFLLIFILVVFFYACAVKTPSTENQHIADYSQYLKTTRPTAEIENISEKFESVFYDLKQDNLESSLRQTYAELFYFNDTLETITDLTTLVDYMKKTSDKVKSAQVKILDIVKGKNDYYIRWEMEMKLEVSGRKIHSRSIGMTQLRFNESGKIIFHQDFWDGMEGLYQHLPVIGYILRKVKN